MAQERQPLDQMTLRQLRKVASQYNISRYSRMRKSQLLAAIQEIENEQGVVSSSTNVQVQTTSRPPEVQADVEASKFQVGQNDPIDDNLASVDEGLPDLPSGYGESLIVLMPRDPQWCYAYWDVPNIHREALRRQGGQQLALRIYDITDLTFEFHSPHSVQEYPCDELAREWYIPIPVSDRDYLVEIGYRCFDGRWLVLARSHPVRVPPIYPSDWVEDHFMTISWEQELQGKRVFQLVAPNERYTGAQSRPVYDDIFGLSEAAEAQRLAGSLYGSMQQAPEESVSSYVFPSGVGQWASGAGKSMSGVGMSGAAIAKSMSGVGMSGVGMETTMSGVGMSGVGMETTMSGVGMSGVGMETTMSGVGMSGVGLETMSGVGMMSGVGAVTTSGVGMMSGVGLETMSGVGMMSGVGALTTSGVGMSGVGMQMSGVGMSGIGLETMSGVGMMSGVGLETMSGVGMMSGVGLETMSGVGMMSGVGALTTSGVGMSGVGMQMSGVGMSGIGLETMSGVGMMSGVGLETMSGVGMMSGVGLGVPTMSGVGMSGVGMQMSGVGMSGVGMQMSGVGLGVPTMSGVGMSGVGMQMSGVGLGVPTMSGVGMSGVGMQMSGVGLGVPTMSGVGMSGVGMQMSGYGLGIPTMSGVGMQMSGVGMQMSGVGMQMSGVGMQMSGVGLGLTMSGVGMSGVGFSASAPPIRPRKFWLVADAELIIYGATEPDATVTIGGRPIKLNSDGTFRFQMSFQDGLIDYPIMAVAADGEQMRSIHMKFIRETPSRETNTKDEAVLEWLG
ncbi:DUF4912 domain-containing protein [Spirulina subsalsa FACHB-351]|uniref:DUF4912 domain-containing protein n=1 Tax=Spirulina subsalsa FACHB-351 TaxID=234711 RepID=A0ABT3L2D3_9CYAN|nr:DUF4912 domain-containing protein [Spirulina subsalsa]MCW6035656.1 DUF4912 domain-containing protein [Spirulina subsalsa FACHB-351]